MMNGWNQGGWTGMMGGGMMGGGMMGGYGAMDPQACHGDWGNPGTGTPLTIEEATARAQEYVDSLGNSDLALAEVMEFENNFYAAVEEESTGIHAFELLINRYTGAVTDEPGPNMMWNTQYGHMAGMGGMMGDMGMMGTSRLQVVDARTRQVVADTACTGIGRRVSQREWEAGLPITSAGLRAGVVCSQTVGALLVQGMTMTIV